MYIEKDQNETNMISIDQQITTLIVTADFTMHGGSHLYGLPCPSANSLDPVELFYTFDVSNIIPKNMHYFLYMTFKPILPYIGGYDL